MEAVGIPMVSGANSQWERTDWAYRGKISEGYAEDEVALVFRWDADHMGHVGIYTGDGYVVHAKGHDYGVVRERLADTSFTHWGQPESLYRVVQAHTAQDGWEPDTTPALFTEVAKPGEIPVWEQPTGAQDAYMKGDKVHHPDKNGPVYVSTVDNNVWEPGVYGWDLEEQG